MIRVVGTGRYFIEFIAVRYFYFVGVHIVFGFEIAECENFIDIEILPLKVDGL